MEHRTILLIEKQKKPRSGRYSIKEASLTRRLLVNLYPLVYTNTLIHYRKVDLLQRKKTKEVD